MMHASSSDPNVKIYNIVPPGPVSRGRKVVVGRFPLGAPGFKDGSTWSAGNEKGDGMTRKPRLGEATPCAMLLHKQDQISEATKSYRGIPESSGMSTYFVLMKVGDDFTAYPVDTSFTFRPHNMRGGAVTLEEAEAVMNGASGGTGGGGLKLAPKSVKEEQLQAASRAAMEAKLREEAKAALGDRVDDLAALFEDVPEDMPGKGLVLGSDEEGDGGYGGLGDDDDEEGGEGKRKRKARKGAKGAAPNKKGGTSGEEQEIPEDERPEDVYKGEEDELRPEAPDEEADWEHEEDVQDDDEDIGADNEEYVDDPKIRKKLGLDEEEEEEERAKEEERKRLEAAIEKDRKAAERVLHAGRSVEEDEAEDDEEEEERLEDMDEQEIDFDDLDAMADARDATMARKKSRAAAAPAANAGRERSPVVGGDKRGLAGSKGTPTNRMTPPVRSKTPPLGVGGTKGASASPAAPAPGWNRTKTPPLAAGGAVAGAKRRPDDAAGVRGGSLSQGGSAGDEAAAKRARHSPAPQRSPAPALPLEAGASGAGYGVPTEEEIRAALQGGAMEVKQVVKLFKKRLQTDEEKQEFKERMLRVVGQQGAAGRG